MYDRKRTNTGLTKAVLLSPQTLDSMDSAPCHWALHIHGPTDAHHPMPILSCNLPVLLHNSVLLLQWLPLPERPQFSPAFSATTSQAKLLCPINIPLQTAQNGSLNSSSDTRFLLGPLSFGLGLICCTTMIWLHSKATAHPEIPLGKHFWKLPYPSLGLVLGMVSKCSHQWQIHENDRKNNSRGSNST